MDTTDFNCWGCISKICSVTCLKEEHCNPNSSEYLWTLWSGHSSCFSSFWCPHEVIYMLKISMTSSLKPTTMQYYLFLFKQFIRFHSYEAVNKLLRVLFLCLHICACRVMISLPFFSTRQWIILLGSSRFVNTVICSIVSCVDLVVLWMLRSTFSSYIGCRF